MCSEDRLPINLDRPLAVFDIESTGTSPRADRIIELAAIRVEPDGRETCRHWLVNPGMHIPVESTAIHGITDDIVRECPTFAQIAGQVDAFLKGCDLGGYNVLRFDIPMLSEEFMRAGLNLDVDNRRVLDAQRIYHQREPRDLAAALRFFCGREHADAHGAEADTRATLDVLKGEFRRYDDLPRDMAALDRLFNATDPFNADRGGRLRWVDGELTINFGKKKGVRVKDLVVEDPGYLKWILKGDFPMDTRKIVQDALDGIYPPAPAARITLEG